MDWIYWIIFSEKSIGYPIVNSFNGYPLRNDLEGGEEDGAGVRVAVHFITGEASDK